MPYNTTVKTMPDGQKPLLENSSGQAGYGTGATAPYVPDIQAPNFPEPSAWQRLKGIKFNALFPAAIAALAYVCMNREGSEEINSNIIRWFTAMDSGIINGGLYYLVFSESRHTPKKFQTFLHKYLHIESMTATVLIGATLTPIFLLAAIPMLESTIAGAALLGLPSWLGTGLGWAMTFSRAIAVFQGFIELPETWDYIKRKYNEANGCSKATIAALGAIALVGAGLYVLSMRASVLTGLGNVNAISKGFACGFQKTYTSVHLAIQWAATAVNYPFYALWITRGMIRTFEPIWNKRQRNETGWRSLTVLMALFSLAPSAAPLFSGMASKTAPIIEAGCQITGSWIAPHTQFGFERTPGFQLPFAISLLMPLACFMNISSLLKNFGVYRDKAEAARVIGDPMVPALLSGATRTTSGITDSGESLATIWREGDNPPLTATDVTAAASAVA